MAIIACDHNERDSLIDGDGSGRAEVTLLWEMDRIANFVASMILVTGYAEDAA